MTGAEAKLTSKGQITLPQPVRHKLGVGPGDKVVFVEGSDGKIVVRGKSETLADLRGMLRHKAALPPADVVSGWVDEARSRALPSSTKRRRRAR